MDKLRKKIFAFFRKRYFIALIIIFAIMLAGTSFKFMVKLGWSLAEAVDSMGKKGTPIVEMEMYENYEKNRRIFHEKIEAFESKLNLEEEEAREETIEEAIEEAKEDIIKEDAIKEDSINDNDSAEEKVDIAKDEVNQENREEIEENQEEEVTLPEEEPKENFKIAYLTFDDGPSKIVTPQILDILAHYDIKATFFVVGKYAERYPDILKRIYEEGHVIGNHTYSHNYNYIYRSVSNFVNELDITQEVFKNILGEEFETNIMRFPGGSFEDWKSSFRKQVTDLGYRFVDWNSLNGDAEGHNLSRDDLFKRFKSTFRNQNELIILMHDTDAKASTPEALPAIIEFLIEKGYSFGTL